MKIEKKWTVPLHPTSFYIGRVVVKYGRNKDDKIKSHTV
jgi:hypothetical protein